MSYALLQRVYRKAPKQAAEPKQAAGFTSAPSQCPPALPVFLPQTRNPAWAAEVVSATLKVRLRLGLLRRAIYSLRPGPLTALALGCAAVGMLLGGGGAALLFLGLLLYAGFSSGAGGRAASSAAGDEASSSVSVSALEEVSAASGISEASSSLLREIEEEEGEAGEGQPFPASPLPSAAAAAEKVERWLPSTSAAAAADGQRKPGRPADSAMGSEGSAAVAGLRRRAGGFKLF